MLLYKCISTFGLGLLLIVQFCNAANKKALAADILRNRSLNSLIEHFSSLSTTDKDYLFLKKINDTSQGLHYGEDYNDEERGSLVHFFAMKNDEAALIRYLQKFAIETLEIKTSYGNTCLHLAARTGSLDTLSLIIRYANQQADTDFNFAEFINQPNLHGFTALDLAARSGHVKAVKKLLKQGLLRDIEHPIALKLATQGLRHFSLANIELAARYEKTIQLLTPKDSAAVSS